MNTRITSCLACIVTLFGVSPARDSGRSLPTAPPPSWVRYVAIDPAASADSARLPEGTEYLLVDDQFDVATMSHYVHIAKRIVDIASLEGGPRLTIEYAPENERLEVHYVRLRRAGGAIDLLSRRRFSVLQREEDLESGIYSARLTALLVMEDVQNGDTLEYAFTRSGQSSVFGGRFMATLTWQYGVPIGKRYASLRRPADRAIAIRHAIPDIDAQIVETPATVEYRWTSAHLPAIEEENNLPSWYDPFPDIRMSEFTSWREVADWAAATYAGPSRDTRTLGPMVRGLRQEHPRPEEYAEAALSFVQNEIRYFGEEVGEASFRPTAPDEVLRRRFGDCKDQSLLLCALLRGGGIEADPVLVNVDTRDRVDTSFAWPLAFNHVVVRFKVDERDYVVDPTMAGQCGGLENRCITTRYRGLVVGGEERALIDLPHGCGKTAHTRFDERYEFPGYDSAIVDAVTTYEGEDADRARSSYYATSAEKLEESGRQYYADEYGGVRTLQPLGVEMDDTVNNLFVVRERYAIDSFWVPSAGSDHLVATIYATAFRHLIPEVPGTNRRMPLGVDHPRSVSFHIMAVFPEPRSMDEGEVKIQDPAFTFVRRVTVRDNVINVDHQYSSHRDWVGPADVGEFAANLSRVGENVGAVLYKTDGGLWGISWIFYFVTALSLAGGVVIGRRVLRRDPGPAPGGIAAGDETPSGLEENADATVSPAGGVEDEPSEEGGIPSGLPQARSDEGDASPIEGTERISGWLIVPALGLIISSGSMLFGFGDIVEAFSVDTWTALSTPGRSSYQAWWAPVMILEWVGNLGLFMLIVVAAYAFFKRLRLAPRLMIGVYLSNLFLQVADTWMVGWISTADSEGPDQLTGSIGRAFLAAAIWVPYFLRSKRVKQTFVR